MRFLVCFAVAGVSLHFHVFWGSLAPFALPPLSPFYVIIRKWLSARSRPLTWISPRAHPRAPRFRIVLPQIVLLSPRSCPFGPPPPKLHPRFRHPFTTPARHFPPPPLPPGLSPMQALAPQQRRADFVNKKDKAAHFCALNLEQVKKECGCLKQFPMAFFGISIPSGWIHGYDSFLLSRNCLTHVSLSLASIVGVNFLFC